MNIDIEEIKASLAGYIEEHPLSIEYGSEYIMHDDKAKTDDIHLVCTIFDNM